MLVWPITVPALIAVFIRKQNPPIRFLLDGVQIVELAAKRFEIFRIVRQQKRIAHTQADATHVIVSRTALGVEVPPERSTVPFATPLTADFSVEANIRRGVSA